MLDIETLGNVSNSVIVSIGAVRFDIETGKTGEEFYTRVDIDSCLKWGLKVNGSTIKWWLTKNEEARKEVAKGGDDIKDALIGFANFVNKDDHVWGNGVRFDTALMEDAYSTLGFPVPWDFRKELDVRTLVYFNPKIKVEHINKNKGVSHNAIDDCNIQIAYCSEIYNTLRK